jgi:chromosome partitioning protein
MSTNITFAQPKGGAGKTTAALDLAVELSKRWTVSIIDSDPNAPIAKWAERGGGSNNLKVVQVRRDDSVIDIIEQEEKLSDFVVVDTEGVADLRVAQAISVSDFVIIPSQGSSLDQQGAALAIRLIKDQERIIRRPIPHAVLFTRVNAAIRSRGMAAAEKQLEERGIEIFNTRLIEREAFKAMFSFNKTLDTLESSEVSGIDKAKENSAAFAREMIARLKKAQESQNVPL